MYPSFITRLITIASFCILLLPSLESSAQSAGSMDLGLKGEQSYFLKSHHKSLALGTFFNIWVSEHIALNYTLSLGKDEQGGFLIKTGMGQALGLWLFSLTPYNRENGLAFLALIIPEGLTVSFMPNNEELRVSAYLNPIKIDYLNKWDSFHYAFEVGARASLNLGNDIWAGPSLGLGYRGGTHHWALHGGIDLFFSFNKN